MAGIIPPREDKIDRANVSIYPLVESKSFFRMIEHGNIGLPVDVGGFPAGPAFQLN